MTIPSPPTRPALARALRSATGASARVLIAVLAAATVAGAASALDVGDKAVDFEAPLLSGKRTEKLSALRGKVVYLDFWASWCGPCTQAVPAIEKLRSEFPAEDFQVLAVNVDKSPKKATKFLEKNPIGYPSVSDPRGKLPRQFGLETMPTSYLIDRNGVIRYVHRGFRNGDVDEIRAQIRKLVESRPASRRKK